MNHQKNPAYYLEKIRIDLLFILQHMQDVDLKLFEKDEVLNCRICFKMIQISENAGKLPQTLKECTPEIPWFKISGLRNRIVHDYGKVDFSVVYQTVKVDLPILLKQIESLLN